MGIGIWRKAVNQNGKDSVRFRIPTMQDALCPPDTPDPLNFQVSGGNKQGKLSSNQADPRLV